MKFLRKSWSSSTRTATSTSEASTTNADGGRRRRLRDTFSSSMSSVILGRRRRRRHRRSTSNSANSSFFRSAPALVEVGENLQTPTTHADDNITENKDRGNEVEELQKQQHELSVWSSIIQDAILAENFLDKLPTELLPLSLPSLVWQLSNTTGQSTMHAAMRRMIPEQYHHVCSTSSSSLTAQVSVGSPPLRQDRWIWILELGASATTTTRPSLCSANNQGGCCSLYEYEESPLLTQENKQGETCLQIFLNTWLAPTTRDWCRHRMLRGVSQTVQRMLREEEEAADLPRGDEKSKSTTIRKLRKWLNQEHRQCRCRGYSNNDTNTSCSSAACGDNTDSISGGDISIEVEVVGRFWLAFEKLCRVVAFGREFPRLVATSAASYKEDYSPANGWNGGNDLKHFCMLHFLAGLPGSFLSNHHDKKNEDQHKTVLLLALYLYPEQVRVPRMGQLPLHAAIYARNWSLVRPLLAEFPASATISDNEARLPLHLALIGIVLQGRSGKENDSRWNLPPRGIIYNLLSIGPEALQCPDPVTGLPVFALLELTMNDSSSTIGNNNTLASLGAETQQPTEQASMSTLEAPTCRRRVGLDNAEEWAARQGQKNHLQFPTTTPKTDHLSSLLKPHVHEEAVVDNGLKALTISYSLLRAFPSQLLLT